jgi:hypothetical protein
VLVAGGAAGAALSDGRGFGNGACFGGVMAARFIGLGLTGAGSARCGKRSGGGGSNPFESGIGDWSAVMTRGADGGGISLREMPGPPGGVARITGGGAALP